MSAVLQNQTCNVFIVSLIKLRAVIFRVSLGVSFGRVVRAAVSHRMRPVARLRDAVVPAACLVSITGTSFRMVRRVAILRPRLRSILTLLENSYRLFLSCFVLDYLYTAAAASRCLNTECLLERQRFPLSREAGDLYVL